MKKTVTYVLCVLAVFAGIIMTIIFLVPRSHEYYCDGFLFHADNREYELQELHPDITSVVELLPITKDKLAVVCRVDTESNLLMVYDFKKKDFFFEDYGTQFAWIQDDFNSVLYLKKDIVYDLNGNVIYETAKDKHISVIEYVDTDFMVTETDLNYENSNQIYVEY